MVKQAVPANGIAPGHLQYVALIVKIAGWSFITVDFGSAF